VIVKPMVVEVIQRRSFPLDLTPSQSFVQVFAICPVRDYVHSLNDKPFCDELNIPESKEHRSFYDIHTWYQNQLVLF